MDILNAIQSIQPPSLFGFAWKFAALSISIIGTLVLPSLKRPGAKLKDGSRMMYKMNGLSVLLFSVVLFWIGSDFGLFGLYHGGVLVEKYGELLMSSVVFDTVVTLFFLFRSQVLEKEQLNIDEDWSIIQKFWLGAELNPHIFGFEVKFFWYRPGFVLWGWLNLSCLMYQYENYGFISVPMILFQTISFSYWFDAFWFEIGMAYMFDIIEENFGFMLIWGDFTWIPFVFSLPGLYCIEKFDYSPIFVFATALVFITGYSIFRGANDQKFQFRQNPKAKIWGKDPVTVKSPTGRNLLCSGWWGIARKINYLGDILVAVSFSLPAGTYYILPYLYPIYLTLLLINRASRDDKRCQSKHGEAWKEYCEKVRWTIVPGLY